MNENEFQNLPEEQRPAPKSSGSNLLLIFGLLGGACIIMCLGVSVVAFLLLPRIDGMRSVPSRMVSKNNLKQLALGLHNYHGVHGTFPPGATVNAEEIAHHSWMTQLLPYLDQAPLYKSIDFNNPWDDPVNSALFFTEIPLFFIPDVYERKTFDGYAASHYAANENVLFENSQFSIRDCKDGTSNTFMGGEIKENLPAWGDPANRRDLTLGINSDPDGFGGPSAAGGALIMFMDGRVKFISETVDPDVLKAISTPAGDEIVDDSKF